MQKNDLIIAYRLKKYVKLMENVQFIDQCWVWTGHVSKRTRTPLARWHGVTMPVRNILFHICDGEELTGQLYSTCRDRRCVAPEHTAEGRPKKGYYLN